jgi:hypothetical protein
MQLRRECGQALILVALAMPLLMSIAALVVDGTNLMVHRRQLQTAADAAALAASRNVSQYLSETHASLTCDNTWATEKNNASRITIVRVIEDYSSRNNGPTTLDGGTCSWDQARCSAATDRNCYTWPYKGNNSLVEVRLKESVGGFFTRAVDAVFPGDPLGNAFTVSARAVSSANPVITTTTTPGTTYTVTDPDVVSTGATHTTTDPGITIGGDGVGFAMSRVCDNAIIYSGAGSGGIPLGSFATNGGMTFSGAKPKKVASLLYDKTRCTSDPVSPPSGTSACTATAWGDATDLNDYCVKTLIDLGANFTLPINWLLTPPTAPTPSSTWNASTDYPSKCFNLGSSGNITFTTTGHPPGIYCVSGPSTSLTIPGLDLTGGDGYTFFALQGASVEVNGNPALLKFYWPSACGSRPTTRPTSYTCFGRTITGYDPLTLLYATNQTNNTGQCPKNAICLDGNSGSYIGDIFAPKPDAFPPTPTLTQNGGTVFVAGGAVSAGSGFIQSWNLIIQGNTGSYTGNGPGIVIPGATHTTTDPSTTITGATTTTTVPGSTQTQTTGTTLGLDE